MLASLSSLLFFALALLGFGFVVFIHELGHFVFAKWAGVRVETFSLGFPLGSLRPLWAYTRGETTYQIAWLPLGGYVKMSGQEDVPTGNAMDVKDQRSYLAKSAGWKALILLGGVLFNLVSSYLILIGLAIYGMPVIRPVVGDVEAQIVDQRGLPVASPAAQLGLQRGDLIVAVGGSPVRSFEDVITDVILAGDKPLRLDIERGGQHLSLPASATTEVRPVFAGRLGRPELGIKIGASGRVIDLADAGDSGLRRFDRIVEVAGEDVSHLVGQDIADRLLRHFGEPIAVTVERGGARVPLTVVYAGSSGAFDTAVGLPVRISAVSAGSAAAGIVRIGDIVSSVDGHPVCGTSHFLGLVRRAIDAGGPVTLALHRGTADIEVHLAATALFGVKRLGLGVEPLIAGQLPALPPAIGGGPSVLAGLGVKAGDVLIGWEQGEKDVTVAWLSGGETAILPLGLDTDAWQQANRERNPGPFARLFGRTGQPGLAERLVGRRVAEVRAEAIVLADRRQPPRMETVERRQLGPAAEALKVGDWVADARLAADGAVIEVVHGAGDPRTATAEPKPVGTAVLMEMEELPYEGELTLGDRVALVNDAAYNLVVKGTMLLPRMFRAPEQGGVDPNKSLTGPIGIFRQLKARVELMGFASFLKFLALVGLNLFVVNLLPIPITDGGQLLILGVETAIRRPLPMRLRNGLLYAGVGVVGLLFIYICGLDILRIFGLG